MTRGCEIPQKEADDLLERVRFELKINNVFAMKIFMLLGLAFQ